MPRPAATVVIPCFNHGRFVGDAVRSALGQRNADTRVVLVDDGSDDGHTRAACDDLASERVTVVHQANLGLPAARNRGAASATTDWLVFLDADDWIEPDFVSRLAAQAEAESRRADRRPVSHAYCQERLVELGTGVWRVPEWDPNLLLITNLHPVTALVSRACFEAAGGFDESMRHGYEDWDFWLRLAGRGWRGVRVAEPLFVWRRHSHTTMVMGVIKDHESLFRRIVANHPGLYGKDPLALVVAMNAMLRRFDMHWLDESLDPVALCALRRARDDYESMAAVRLHRWLLRRVGRLPAPLRAAARWALDFGRRHAPRPRGRLLPADLAADRLHSV